MVQLFDPNGQEVIDQFNSIQKHRANYEGSKQQERDLDTESYEVINSNVLIQANQYFWKYDDDVIWLIGFYNDNINFVINGKYVDHILIFILY